MNGETRREHILNDINITTKPISATKLASKYNVSRQIIVGDIALLRASGHDIISTARGYLKPSVNQYIQQVAVSHNAEDTEKELMLIVNNGGTVLDVTVEHPLYGSLTGRLDIQTKADIRDFLRSVQSGEAELLLVLTNGIHLHRISCKDKTTFSHIEKALDEAGFLYRND